MRRWPILAILLVVPCLASCGGGAEPPRPATLTLVDGGANRPVTLKAWALPSAGRVVGIGGTPGRVLVAQRRRLSLLRPGGSAEGLFEPSAGSRLAALSLHGLRIAVATGDEVRAGRVGAFDPNSTALDRDGLDGTPIVLDGHPARVFDGTVWDLDVPRLAMTPHTFGAVSAFDPRQRWLATGKEEGRVAVASARTGHFAWQVPRGSPAHLGDGIAAVAISTGGAVVSLDEAGWASCGSASVRLFPMAAPGMPAAIAIADGGFWAIRGGIAAFVDCGSEPPRKECELRTDEDDPRSPALLALRGHVYAAGVREGKVVLLPRCR